MTAVLVTVARDGVQHKLVKLDSMYHLLKGFHEFLTR